MTQAPQRGRLYVVSAPSGAGKTSLTHALIERLATRDQAIRFSVSYTTRRPRPGERDGVDYHFVRQTEFERMIAAGAFLEHAWVFDRYYGTARAATEQLLAAGSNVVLDIDWQGARQVRARSADAVLIFIQPPSTQELERRLRARGSEDEASLARRLHEADAELAHAAEYDYRVINDRFEDALAQLEAIFSAPRAGLTAGDSL